MARGSRTISSALPPRRGPRTIAGLGCGWHSVERRARDVLLQPDRGNFSALPASLVPLSHIQRLYQTGPSYGVSLRAVVLRGRSASYGVAGPVESQPRRHLLVLSAVDPGGRLLWRTTKPLARAVRELDSACLLAWFTRHDIRGFARLSTVGRPPARLSPAKCHAVLRAAIHDLISPHRRSGPARDDSSPATVLHQLPASGNVPRHRVGGSCPWKNGSRGSSGCCY